MDQISSLMRNGVNTDEPVLLYSGDHQVYWVGSEEASPFRCNAYLIVDGDVRVLFDPGSTMHHFPQVKKRVASIIPPESVTHIVLHHQDPDVSDSLPEWVKINPEVTLVATPRARVLLPYFGFPHDVKWLDASPNDNTVLELPSGSVLGFITAPFLHFPEALTTFDEASGFLLTGDIFAAIDPAWKLLVSDWETHWRSVVPFHVFYMASNRALAGYIDKVAPFPIKAILPQHGSVIPEQHVRKALEALRELPCGVDLLYPASNLESAISALLK